MKWVKLSWLVALVSLVVMGLNLPGNAAEIIYEDDIITNVVTKDVLVRTADNAIVLVDAGSSMGAIHPKYKKTSYEMEKQAIASANMRLPLAIISAFTSSPPPGKRSTRFRSLTGPRFPRPWNSCRPKHPGRTPLMGTFQKLEGVLKNLSGKTVIYIFSDGGYLQTSGKDPGNRARELASKYNVCFVVIDYAKDPDGLKQVKDLGRANACTRVIPFDAFIANPYYSTGLLYFTKSVKTEEIVSKKKAVGVKVTDIRFDYDTIALKSQEKEELNQLGKYLQANPKAFVAVQGFTDNRGTAEYNLRLSRERAEAVTDYLMKNFKLDSGRVATMWYGEANPVASNDSAENRWKNRRVEIAVGGL